MHIPLSGGCNSPGGAVPRRGLLAAGEGSLRCGEVFTDVGLVLGRELEEPAGLKLLPVEMLLAADAACLPALLGPGTKPG